MAASSAGNCVMRACLLLLFVLLFAPAAIGAQSPSLMLATDYEAGADVAYYWVSEKLDGVRGRWDGRALWTRGGHRIDAPGWFIAGWPEVALDDELWIGRGRFEVVSGLVRARRRDDDAWRHVRFMVFVLPGHAGSF